MLLGADIDKNNLLFRLKEALRHMIDPDFLLPAELVSQDVLTDEERQKVKSKDTYQEKNDVLLKFVIQKDDATLVVVQFTDCLRNTDQDHVCNFICCNGGKQTCCLLFYVHCDLYVTVIVSDSCTSLVVGTLH